jgi:DNA-binding transcriptional regulator YiaG
MEEKMADKKRNIIKAKSKPDQPKKIWKKPKKKERNIAQEIKEGLLETLEFLKGNETEGRIVYLYHGNEICPREIRETQLHLTREVFHEYFDLGVNSQRNWELGLRTPPDHTLAYYKLIRTNPEVVYQMLHNAQLPVPTNVPTPPPSRQ